MKLQLDRYCPVYSSTISPSCVDQGGDQGVISAVIHTKVSLGICQADHIGEGGGGSSVKLHGCEGCEGSGPARLPAPALHGWSTVRKQWLVWWLQPASHATTRACATDGTISIVVCDQAHLALVGIGVRINRHIQATEHSKEDVCWIEEHDWTASDVSLASETLY